jgi:hypothetical protein
VIVIFFETHQSRTIRFHVSQDTPSPSFLHQGASS